MLTAGQARRPTDAGAAFAVAPGTDDAVIDACRELGLPFVPGAATRPRSAAYGASAVGREALPGFVARRPPFVARDERRLSRHALRADRRHRAPSLRSYLDVPSVLACGGSWLADGRLLAERRFDEIERRARETVELAR